MQVGEVVKHPRRQGELSWSLKDQRLQSSGIVEYLGTEKGCEYFVTEIIPTSNRYLLQVGQAGKIPFFHRIMNTEGYVDASDAAELSDVSD